MHRLKGVCCNLPELGTPKSVFVLRSRIERLKQAATEMLVSFRQDPGKFSTGRFEVSIARAANVDKGCQKCQQHLDRGVQADRHGHRALQLY